MPVFVFLFFVCLFVCLFFVGIFRGSQKETHSSRLGLADSQVVVHVKFRFTLAKGFPSSG